jgi:hypothetical protein
MENLEPVLSILYELQCNFDFDIAAIEEKKRLSGPSWRENVEISSKELRACLIQTQKAINALNNKNPTQAIKEMEGLCQLCQSFEEKWENAANQLTASWTGEEDSNFWEFYEFRELAMDAIDMIRELLAGPVTPPYSCPYELTH